MNRILGEWREVERSPCTGKCSARSLLPAWEHLRRSLPRHSIPAATKLPGPSVGVFKAWRNLSVRCGFRIKTKPWGGNQLPPAGWPRAQGKERAGRITPFSSSAMSSGRLFLDRVGRHQSPSPLHRHEQSNTDSQQAPAKHDISTLPGTRHFYFALTESDWELTRGRDRDMMHPCKRLQLSRRSNTGGKGVSFSGDACAMFRFRRCVDGYNGSLPDEENECHLYTACCFKERPAG